MTGVSTIRSLIRQILSESVEDITLIDLVLRLKTNMKRSIPDILTDLRGVQGVVTVTQLDTSKKAEDRMARVYLRVKFNNNGEVTKDELLDLIKSVEGVDMLTVKPSPNPNDPEAEPTIDFDSPSKSPEMPPVRRPRKSISPDASASGEAIAAPVAPPRPKIRRRPKPVSPLAPTPDEMKIV